MNNVKKYYYMMIDSKTKTFAGFAIYEQDMPEKPDDGVWFSIKITEDDYNMYLQALKDNKEIYVDDDGKIQTRYKLKE